MLFNSIEFAVFLPSVFAVYWLIGSQNPKGQNVWLLLASYVFYGWWDVRFLSLIALSSGVDYIVGLALGQTRAAGRRKGWLWLSVLVNLGMLAFFKYFDFFAENFSAAFTLLGRPIALTRLNLILPIGISFYTFQTLSYTIDVYRGQLAPSRDPVAFFAFVSFFPQLVAGPIERATHLLPQFARQRRFSYAEGLRGMSQILWGLFKKVVVADNCALIVNQIFDQAPSYGGSTLLLGAVLFAFQIYGDFSGYSDMAIGSARLFGIRLAPNFAYPYFARSVAEFWRRWHLSLNTWFRDYLYIPLGGSRGSRLHQLRNVLVIFVVSGFWHGASWNFIFWGMLHAAYFLPLLLTQRNRKNLGSVAPGRLFPTGRDLISMGSTFGLVTLAWVFFRAESLPAAFAYLERMFSPSLLSPPYVFGIGAARASLTLGSVALMLVIEWLGREQEIPIYREQRSHGMQWSILYLLTMVVFLLGAEAQDFMYFQF
jgi:alginate O-acetyltransferase complex protein AlgI